MEKTEARAAIFIMAELKKKKNLSIYCMAVATTIFD